MAFPTRAEPYQTDIAPDTTVTSTVFPTVRTPTSDVDNFNKQIRRTPGDFKPFKKDTEWSNWNRALLATANAQGVQSSYDINYIPTEEEKPLFKCQQVYNFSVLRDNVLTPFGLGAVRKHEKEFDAQGVYRDLTKHYTTGVTATLVAQALEEEILGMRLDSSHKKGCEYFLNVWHLKVQELESRRDEPIPGPQKRIWLTTTLQTHTQMATAITQASTMEFTLAGLNGTAVTVLDFFTFFELCSTTAKHIDKGTQVAATKQRARQPC